VALDRHPSALYALGDQVGGDLGQLLGRRPPPHWQPCASDGSCRLRPPSSDARSSEHRQQLVVDAPRLRRRQPGADADARVGHHEVRRPFDQAGRDGTQRPVVGRHHCADGGATHDLKTEPPEQRDLVIGPAVGGHADGETV